MNTKKMLPMKIMTFLIAGMDTAATKLRMKNLSEAEIDEIRAEIITTMKTGEAEMQAWLRDEPRAREYEKRLNELTNK